LLDTLDLPLELSLQTLPCDGYLFKHELCEGAVHLLRAVAGGATFFSKAVVEALSAQSNQLPSLAAIATELSPREQEVLELMLQGCDNQQIGTTLHLNEQTVRNYVSKIYEKLTISEQEKLCLRMRMRLK
jgi:two-component system, NarL family, nitrate/nitrite response regulator NarL